MIAPQRRGMREEEVRHQNRLGPSQVRVRGHHGSPCPLRLVRHHADECSNLPLDLRHAPFHVQTQIERHLLIAGAAGMKAAAGLPDPLHQLALHERVHILVVGGASG